MNRYIVRKENFGGLLFDRINKTIKSLNNDEYYNLYRKKENIDFIELANSNFSSLSSPTKVFIGLTNKCNLKCIHCSINSGGKEELKFNEIVSIIKQLKELGVFIIGINGGEPLCHPDFFEISRLIKELGFMLSINTNGAFNRYTIDKLATSDIDSIRISIDGMESSHDLIRGNGVFKIVTENIKYLKLKNCNVSINFTISKQNKIDLFEIIEFAKLIDCKIKIAPMQNVGRAVFLKDEILSLNERQQIYNDVVNRYEVNTKTSLVHITESFITENCIEIKSKFNYQFSSCGNRRVHMSIDSDGKVYTTGRQTDFINNESISNAKTESILSIWNKIKQENENLYTNNPICRNCNINSFLANSFNDLILN